MLNELFSRSTFQITAIYHEVLRQVCAAFGIVTFQEEQQKAIDIFFEGNDVSLSLPTGYGKSLLYQAASVVDHLSSLGESGHYFFMPPVKVLREDQVHYLNALGPRGLSAFNFRSLCERCCEGKLKPVVSCSDFFDFRRVALSSRLHRNYLSRKPLKSLRLCGKWSTSFRRPWHCLQMQAETAWTLKSGFVSAMLIENRLLPTLCQKPLMISSCILKSKYAFELGRWIANLPEKWKMNTLQCCCFLDSPHANTCHFATKQYQVTLFCIS